MKRYTKDGQPINDISIPTSILHSPSSECLTPNQLSLILIFLSTILPQLENPEGGRPILLQN